MIQAVRSRAFREVVVGADPAIVVREWPACGAVVLLLHGLSHNLEVWSPVVDSLPRENRILAVDLRGHGKSESASGHGYEDHVGDVLTVLDGLDVSAPVIVGHSWGGRVALYFAAKCPDRCRGVVALDQALWDYEPPSSYLSIDLGGIEPLATPLLSEDEAAALRTGSSEWGNVWASVLKRSLEQTPEGWLQRPVPNDVRALTVAEAKSQPVEPLYAQILAPIVMLFAANDSDFGFARPIGRQANVEYIRTAVPSAKIAWVDGDHSFFVDNPTPVAAAVASILAHS